MQQVDTQVFLDRMAMAVSALCAVHCLATPLLVALVPVLASTLFVDETFHRWMLLAIVPTSVVALGLGCRRHRSRRVLLLGVAGLTLIVVAALWGHDWIGEVGERVATLIGGSLIAAAHACNYRLCRGNRCPE